MSKFGWSYPPGCSGTPYDDDYPCELCGCIEGRCTCPVCGICDAQGNPLCYDNEGHGLEETWKQEEYRRTVEILMRAFPDHARYADNEELLDDFATIDAHTAPSFQEGRAWP